MSAIENEAAVFLARLSARKRRAARVVSMAAD